MLPLIGLAAGARGGYLDRQDKERRQAIEDEDRAFQKDVRDRQRADWKQQDGVKLELAKATAPAVITTDLSRTLPEDQAGPSLTQYKVTGQGVNQNFDDEASAKTAASEYDKPAARTMRLADAQWRGGNYEKSMEIETAQKKSRLADFELSAAEQKHLDDIANREIQNEIDANGGDVFGTAASILTKTNVGGLKGVKVVGRPSDDGKTMSMVAIGPDGGERILREYSNDQEGHLAAHQDLLKANPMEKMKWAHERVTAAKKSKAALQEYELKLRELTEVKIPNAETKAKIAEIQGEISRLKSNGGAKPPAGYRWSADGTRQEAIPGGPADSKIQGAFNSDVNALTGSLSSFDRLATAANEVLNHPGLNGITGWRGKIPNAPGTDAANAEALLSTLKSQVGFGVLQDMRNQSKTGGALGAVSERELAMLQSNLAALDKAQSFEQYRDQLKKIIDYTEQAKGRMRESFNLRHPTDGQPGIAQNADQERTSGGRPGAGRGAASQPKAPIPMPKAKAEMVAGSIYQTSRGPAKWNGTAFEAQ